MTFFFSSQLAFAQIGQVFGPSHQNRSVARGCIPGENISAQPCVEVKLFLLSALHTVHLSFQCYSVLAVHMLR